MASSNIARLGVVLAMDTAEFTASIDKAIAENTKLKAAITRQSDAAAAEIARLKFATDDYGKTLTQVAIVEREIASGRYTNATTVLKDQLLSQAKAYDNVANSGKKVTGVLSEQHKIALMYQSTDLFTQLASGQSPLIALIQQGGQLKDQMGGIGPMFRTLGAAITPAMAVAAAAAAVFGTLAAAFYFGSKESAALRDALLLTNNYAGQTQSTFTDLSRTTATKLSVSVGEARDAFMELVKSGKYTKETLGGVGEAILRTSKLTGESADSVAKRLIPAFDGTAAAALRLNEQTHFLTLKIYKQIEAAERAGQVQKAIQIETDAYNANVKTSVENIGYMEKAWKGLGLAITSAWDALKNIGRDQTPQERLAALDKQMAAMGTVQDAAKAGGMRGDSSFVDQWKNRYEALRMQREKLMEQINLAAANKPRDETKDITDYAAAGGAAQVLAITTATAKIQNEADMARRMEGASEDYKISLETAKKIADATDEFNKDSAGKQAVFSGLYLNQWWAKVNAASKEGDLKQRALDKKRFEEALNRQGEMQAAEEEARGKSYRDQGEYQKKQTDAIELQSKELVLAKEKLGLAQELQFTTDVERKLAESRFTLEKEILKVKQDWQLSDTGKGVVIRDLKALQAQREELIKMQDATDKTGAKWDSVFQNMTSAMETFVRTGKLSFSSLAKSIIADLMMIEMRAQAKSIFGLLKLAVLGGGGGGPVTDTSSLEGYGPGRASGGPVSGGSPYMVGEVGPELFVPSSAGTIIPNNAMGSLGGTTNVTNYNISAIDTKSFEERILGSANVVWAANMYAGKGLATAPGRA